MVIPEDRGLASVAAINLEAFELTWQLDTARAPPQERTICLSGRSEEGTTISSEAIVSFCDLLVDTYETPVAVEGGILLLSRSFHTIVRTEGGQVFRLSRPDSGYARAVVERSWERGVQVDWDHPLRIKSDDLDPAIVAGPNSGTECAKA